MATTTTAQEKNRYLTRLAAMHRLANDATIGGQQPIAQNHLEKHLSQFAQYGYTSREHALNAALSPDETFTKDDFIKGGYGLKKGSPEWMRLSICACSYQMQVFPVNNRQTGEVLLFGPKERIENAIWMFDQLVTDLKAGARKAWGELEDKSTTTQRRFSNAYCLAIVDSLYKSQREQFMRDRDVTATQQLSPSATRTGLVFVGSSIATNSYAQACELCRFSQKTSRGVASSTAGRDAGLSAASQYANRRMTSGARALPG